MPNGTTISLKEGHSALLPQGVKKIQLTRPDSEIDCSFYLPAGGEATLQDLSKMKLVVSSATYGPIYADIGSGSVQVDCRDKKGHNSFQVKSIRKALDPKFELAFPKSISVDEKPAHGKGAFKVENHYKDCSGKVAGDFEIKFSKGIPVTSGMEKIDLAPCCTLRIYPSDQERLIGEGEIISVGAWEFSRTVKQVEGATGLFKATAKHVVPDFASIECEFTGAIPADKEVCSEEFLQSLKKTFEHKDSVVSLTDLTKEKPAGEKRHQRPMQLQEKH